MTSFTLSFDCEGKWGLVNFKRPHSHITNNSLVATYTRICEILYKYRIPATFAFVGALLIDERDLGEFKSSFEPMLNAGQDWFGAYSQNRDHGTLDGWHCDKLINIVSRYNLHEIASHGFSHIPFHPNYLTFEDASREISSVRLVEAFYGRKSKTFVYPCNIVGYSNIIFSKGFLGYRPAFINELDKGILRRARNLITEFFVNEKLPDLSNFYADSKIPYGRFINNFIGARALVPNSLTKRKLLFFLNRAIKENMPLHLYSHPEDFVNNENLFEVFEHLCSTVAELRDSGLMTVKKQDEFF